MRYRRIRNNILLSKEKEAKIDTKCPCSIKVVMLEVENKMKKILANIVILKI